jgi:hypothetical protein
MKSVNIKSTAETETGPLAWRKYSIYFHSAAECNALAMPIAAMIRSRVALLYYARYTGALESRLDIYFATTKPVPPKETLRLPKKLVRWTKVVGPTPCAGSAAHGWAFDAVLRISAALSAMPAEQMRNQFIDVIHWMHNMFGIDYVDEARCHLASINCVLNVFDNSIRMGNKVAKAQRKAPKASRN